jgi:hypothetical protein
MSIFSIMALPDYIEKANSLLNLSWVNLLAVGVDKWAAIIMIHETEEI